MYIQYIVDSSS